ncbi:MAG: hypothetical protein PVG39_01315 [Desulfobacteraceae bacterium]|jgi:hypothetical protein
MSEQKKRLYRIFYKKQGDPATEKSSSYEELSARNFLEAYNKAAGPAKKKRERVVMVAEIG